MNTKIETVLIISCELGYVDEQEKESVLSDLVLAIKMINGLICSMKDTP
jgi:hypothetical protein